MDGDRVLKTKKRALARRAAAVDRIKAVYDLGLLGESDLNAREQFLMLVNDLTELWSKFTIENDAVLEAMIDLNEEQSFSSSIELEANNMLIKAKTMAKRFSLNLNFPDTSSADIPCGVPSDTAGSSKSPTSLPIASQTAQSSRDFLVRLPEIPLPRFEGNLTDWPVFRDRFLALVDSRSAIANIEKFYYLLNCLGSEAADVVKGIAVSNETYPIAWAALVERYDQPRRLASSIIDKMLSAIALPQESVPALNKFLSTFDENIAVLKSLQIPNLGDFLMFSIAFRTLPVSSRRLFEMHNTDEYPSARDLFKFVKGRVQVLELAGANVQLSSVGKPFAAKLPKVKRDWFPRERPATSLVISMSERSCSYVWCGAATQRHGQPDVRAGYLHAFVPSCTI